MVGLLVCFGGLLAAGLFFLAADLLRLPYLKTSKAMINTGRENRKAAKSLETYLLTWFRGPFLKNVFGRNGTEL